MVDELIQAYMVESGVAKIMPTVYVHRGERAPQSVRASELIQGYD